MEIQRGQIAVVAIVLAVVITGLGGYTLNAETVTTCDTTFSYVTDVSPAFRGSESDLTVEYSPRENATGYYAMGGTPTVTTQYIESVTATMSFTAPSFEDRASFTIAVSDGTPRYYLAPSTVVGVGYITIVYDEHYIETAAQTITAVTYTDVAYSAGASAGTGTRTTTVLYSTATATIEEVDVSITYNLMSGAVRITLSGDVDASAALTATAFSADPTTAAWHPNYAWVSGMCIEDGVAGEAVMESNLSGSCSVSLPTGYDTMATYIQTTTISEMTNYGQGGIAYTQSTTANSYLVRDSLSYASQSFGMSLSSDKGATASTGTITLALSGTTSAQYTTSEEFSSGMYGNGVRTLATVNGWSHYRAHYVPLSYVYNKIEEAYGTSEVTLSVNNSATWPAIVFGAELIHYEQSLTPYTEPTLIYELTSQAYATSVRMTSEYILDVNTGTKYDFSGAYIAWGDESNSASATGTGTYITSAISYGYIDVTAGITPSIDSVSTTSTVTTTTYADSLSWTISLTGNGDTFHRVKYLFYAGGVATVLDLYTMQAYNAGGNVTSTTYLVQSATAAYYTADPNTGGVIDGTSMSIPLSSTYEQMSSPAFTVTYNFGAYNVGAGSITISLGGGTAVTLGGLAYAQTAETATFNMYLVSGTGTRDTITPSCTVTYSSSSATSAVNPIAISSIPSGSYGAVVLSCPVYTSSTSEVVVSLTTTAVRWTNGYDNSAVGMLLRTASSSSVAPTYLTLITRDGTTGSCSFYTAYDGDGNTVFCYNGATGNGNLTLGGYQYVYVRMEVSDGCLIYHVYPVLSFTSYTSYRLTSISQDVTLEGGAWVAISDMYWVGLDSAAAQEHLVTDTVIFLANGGEYNVDASLDVFGMFPQYDVVKLIVNAAVHVGDGLTIYDGNAMSSADETSGVLMTIQAVDPGRWNINGILYNLADVEFVLVGSPAAVRIDGRTYTSGYYVAGEKYDPNHVYMKAGRTGDLVDIGSTTAPVVRMDGQWAFSANLYEGENVAGERLEWGDLGTWSWDWETAALVFLGVMILSSIVMMWRHGYNWLDLSILGGSIAIILVML